jgi:hypothetical protein
MTGDEEEVVMIRRAVFGKQVESFMNSEIGRYMVARAIEQKQDAQNAFLKVDCSDAESVRKLQNEIFVAESIVGWLRDAVGDGVQALNILEDRS